MVQVVMTPVDCDSLIRGHENDIDKEILSVHINSRCLRKNMLAFDRIRIKVPSILATFPSRVLYKYATRSISRSVALQIFSRHT
ncbi:hypothetical protein AMTR_s00049p00174860 [Amborella trichopoda]|uniref:Uncharacterized protein n=1 Tax=Amborella trichopoda TaxID=13333 RepID=W1PZD7_AMBTC|nr:hypothetical protein AMTR_s00049p00174860 [Amborella trichopoda]